MTYINVYNTLKSIIKIEYYRNMLNENKFNINDIYREVYTNVKDESYKMGDMKIQEPTIDGNLKLKL